jgi:hypothetical protein
VTQKVTHDWKYVPFPITFSQAPVVLTTLISETEVSAAVVQQRNIYNQGFQLRLREEDAADHQHIGEKVAWLAIEPSSQSGGLSYQAGTFANVGHELDTLNFGQIFPDIPLFFAKLQTTKESDAATIRLQNQGGSAVEFFIQEESSLDAETNHQNETMGLLAIGHNSVLEDSKGEVFGEMGHLNITNAWATVQLARSYTKPVLIIGGISNNDTAPVTIRARNATSNSFQVRAQEWGYQDGNHGPESISWMVVEGAIPGNGDYYCSGNIADLQPAVNVFAIDNCDNLTAFNYEVSASTQLNTGLLTVRTWMAVDDCGNTNLITRYDTCSTAAVQVRGALYGAMMSNGGGDKMRDNLRQYKRVPVFEPYSALPAFPHVDYGVHDSLIFNNNGGGISLPDITICHKPGTAEQATINVSPEELAIHLGHGDMVGACGNDNSGLVTICHKPGTPAQKTKVVPQSALAAHLAHGDLIGECSSDDNQVPAAAQDAQFRTIADGPWTSPATWANGNVPPTTNINNKTISITHKVVVQNSDLHLQNNAVLWVTHGSLKMINGIFKIEKGKAYFSNSVFDMATAGNLEIINSQGVLQFHDCFVTIGQNIMNNSGALKFENTSLTVGENFENSGGKDSLINVCAIIEGNFKSNGGSTNYLSDAKLRLTNGDFENNAGSIINGLHTVILVENGLLSSFGTWLGSIDQYCVSGTVLGLVNSILQGPENCTDIANYFNPCSCDEDGDEGGFGPVGNIGNAGIGAFSDDFDINPGKSFGGGSIEPSTLDITGDDAVVDWVLVELRNPENDREVLGYSTVLLQRDGDIVSENGDSVIMFPGLPEGEYYVALRHRNHLALMTDVPFFLSTQNTPEIDFSDLSLPVRGGSQAGRVANGKRTQWSGDYNGDGKVIYQGPFNDIFHLFSRVLSDSSNEEILANYIVLGYEQHDFNLDGRVIYQGPSNDKAPLLYNSILSHPANTSLLANYIVKTMIP